MWQRVAPSGTIGSRLRRAYVIDDEFDHLSVIDLDTGRVLGSYDAGTSPTGLVVDAASTPLYRLYDDGQGGAPNHRYTANRGTRDRMRGVGWLSEGNGPDEIFACTPTLRGD